MDSQMGQEGCDFLRAKIAWVPLAVEQDESTFPVDVGFFGPDRVVAPSNGMPQAVQELGLRRRERRSGVGLDAGSMRRRQFVCVTWGEDSRWTAAASSETI
jgi:hypothetical protein